jgi:hypothetical protein
MSKAISRMRARTAQNVDGTLLSTALQQHTEITAAYLYGSFAEGVAHQRSDVDVAMLLEESFNLEHFLEYRMELADELSQLLSREVDVVVLNEAPLLLQFQAIKCRQILFERDPEKRALFEMRVMSRFYDYQRFFDFHARQLRDALKRRELGVREKSY